MIKVYNKQSNFVVIGNKHIAPFKSEEFPERNVIIRSLERNGIVTVTEVAPINSNPTSPDIFNYEVKKEQETVKEVAENKETVKVEEPIEEKKEETKTETVEEVKDEVVEEKTTKKASKRKSKKGAK